MREERLINEFENQVNNLLQKGYPEAAHLTNVEFLEFIEPLRDVAEKLNVSDINFQSGYLPFVIVIKSELVPTHTAISLVEKDGKQGIEKLFPHKPDDFQIVSEEVIPDSLVYLLVDIDRGNETRNLPPREALVQIRKANRHLLTIDAGIAIVTHYPEFLIKNYCFSLLASRNPGDKRVPAIWINSKKQPNLGWCWDGNPHTWLGSASCRNRIGSLS